jgi:hypothetical protein
MCSKEEYDKWERGELFLDKSWDTKKQFITREEAIQKLKDNEYDDLDYKNEDDVNEAFRDEDLYTSKQYWDNCELETFEKIYTTKSGEVIIAFGYYGYDN